MDVINMNLYNLANFVNIECILKMVFVYKLMYYLPLIIVLYMILKNNVLYVMNNIFFKIINAYMDRLVIVQNIKIL